ncbi:MAG: SH3 domain-containing protein [Actinomycetota bacterium]|nr:SH3 domain-containing protein [Actinomycetota bacterium]
MNRQRWFIVGAVLVGILLLISDHNKNSLGSGLISPGGGLFSGSSAAPCTVTVTADSLDVRSSPDGNAPVVDHLDKGSVVSADRTTVNGFRQLGTDRWAAQEFLDPTPDSDCG